MSEKGNLFANKINKKINNNDSVFYSNLNERNSNLDEKKKNSKNIYQKINEIFTSKNYIYKADVILVTKNGDIKKRLVGRNNNYLITAENELIPIVDIKDIKYQ